MDKRRRWISVLLSEGLRLGVLEAADILRFTTPAVLATDLPPTLVAKVLQAGMLSSTFNPDVVVSTLGTENLAEHIPLPILWKCIDEAAKVIIAEHPLTQRGNDMMIAEPDGVRADEMPDIEVVEG